MESNPKILPWFGLKNEMDRFGNAVYTPFIFYLLFDTILSLLFHKELNKKCSLLLFSREALWRERKSLKV